MLVPEKKDIYNQTWKNCMKNKTLASFMLKKKTDSLQKWKKKSQPAHLTHQRWLRLAPVRQSSQ